MRECRGCLVPKSEELFYPRQRICKDCDRARATAAFRVRPELTEAERKDLRSRANQREKKRRSDPVRRPYVIWRDSRAADRKNNRLNDLTVPFIEALIASGCSYCGDLTLKMTVDRIENTIGHLQTNVVSACVRCNYFRRDMPYLAWLEIAKVLQRIREEGLFAGWVGGACTGK